ncbi:hypothetical protein G4B88_030276 [Cannabis sativa]|uniref:Uncharacterized protein n=1 Tax=Cannabis sativa TaxID=3483 RepID=A0A7J6DJA7_CANSA|nr:hypothetical protein G4B88_030123 [Cannabis sativa]KAF4346165.1 hypothetical protein G4B88_030124 [Cannabis sativa]KAF4346166.1 hypothetical protein G4B88_030125 [Cannabis sativa]KAF4381369.1 hypothetical protein G4B88_030276 [Cannabis sativa]
MHLVLDLSPRGSLLSILYGLSSSI